MVLKTYENIRLVEEFKNLFEAGLMTAEELNDIRETGLKELSNYI